MILLLRLVACWTALSLTAVLLLFWHIVGLCMASRASSWRVTLALGSALLVVAILGLMGAVGTFGLWTLREGGRRAAIGYLAVLFLLSLAAVWEWHATAAVGAAFLYGVPLAALFTPGARDRCARSTRG